MTESTEDRPIQNFTVDGQTTTYVTPQQQAVTEKRAAETSGLQRRKSIKNFLRMFRITTQDRP